MPPKEQLVMPSKAFYNSYNLGESQHLDMMATLPQHRALKGF